MNSLMKTIKDAFSIIFEFINEVQEIGCIENSSFSCNFVTLNEDISIMLSYAKSLSKLLGKLQELQNVNFQKSSLMNELSNEDSEDEVVSSTFVYHEQNLDYSHSSSIGDSNGSYVKSIKYKEVYPYNTCQSTTSENFSANNFPKSEVNQIITEKDVPKNYYSTPSGNQQKTLFPENTLATSFESLHDQTLTNLGHSVDESRIPTNESSSLSEPITSVSNDSSIIHSDMDKSHNRSCSQTYKMELKSRNNKKPSDELKNCRKFVSEKRISNSSERGECDTSCSRIKEGNRFRRKGDASSVCTLCSRSFKTNKHLSLHMKKIHSNTESTIFNNEIALENEGKINLPVYCCRTCHLASRNFTNFKNHFCKTTNDDAIQISNKVLVTNVRKLQQLRQFICETCGIEFRALKRILYHLPRCIPGPYQCNVCSVLFGTLKDLNYHKKKDHKDEKCFSCDECGKSFLRKSSLRKHCISRHEFLESAENKKPPSFKCDACPKNFIKKIFLTNHKIRMHGLEKKYLCQVCGKKFMSNNSLMIHIEIHKGEKKFICQFCYKKFQRKEKLLHHERMHTGERPFKCNLCDKAFVSRARLNEHVRRHEADKRFECTHCEKSYASSWDLKKHMLKKHGLQISAEHVKVSLKKKNEKLETSQDKIYEVKHSSKQIPNLSSVPPTLNTISDSMNVALIQSTQQCQMHHVQIEQSTISVSETVPAIIHPSNTSVNLVSFNEDLERHCVRGVENHISVQPITGSILNTQHMRSPQILYSASHSSSRLNYPAS